MLRFTLSVFDETPQQRNLPMAKWRDKIEAAVNTVVNNITPVQTTLVSEEPLKLIINVLDDCSEAAERKNEGC